MKFWRIEGYKGTKKIYERNLRLGCFTDKQIRSLLKVLTAKAGLEFDEIVGAYAKRKTKIANDLLLVQVIDMNKGFTCGDNPFFTARVLNTASK